MWKKAETHLKKSDPKLAAVIKRVGPCPLTPEPDAWKALSSSIIGQQVSVHAARAIRNRFAALEPDTEYSLPEFIRELPDETLRAAGLSGNKTRSVRDLAEHLLDGRLQPDRFAAMDDEEIIAALLPVRGIGRWTAEMFLIFSLNRPDVLAVDDLGLRRAMSVLQELPELPDAATMRRLAEPWQPYRSIASWYLWRSLDNVPD